MEREKMGDKICESCDKSDVCKYQENFMKAVNDILNIEDRTDVFLKTYISCKKWSKKSIEVRLK